MILSTASAGTIDPSQKSWFERYKKQENAPNPGEMLLNVDNEPDLSEGFVNLFNGKDLTGWAPKGGEALFEVHEGSIIGTAVPDTPSTYLCTEREDFTDFIFTCEIRWQADLNTGIMFRAASRKKGDHVEVYGPQAEMEGISGDRFWSGGIYGQSCGGYFYPVWLKEHQAAREALERKGWNRITISTKENEVKTWLNGVPVSNWMDDGSYPKGFIALQVHKAKKGKVEFRNIQIKELTPSR